MGLAIVSSLRTPIEVPAVTEADKLVIETHMLKLLSDLQDSSLQAAIAAQDCANPLAAFDAIAATATKFLTEYLAGARVAIAGGQDAPALLRALSDEARG